jgi:propionate CoA-transferase
MNYRGMHVRQAEDVRRILAAVDALLAPLGHRVHSIVNYEGFKVDDDATTAYMDAVKYVQERYYLSVARYTSNAFLRLKLGHDLAARQLDGHVYGSASEAAGSR